MSQCVAYSIPSTYRPESRRCERKPPRGVHIIHHGKKKTVCWAHVKAYQEKGGEIFKPRPDPRRSVNQA